MQEVMQGVMRGVTQTVTMEASLTFLPYPHTGKGLVIYYRAAEMGRNFQKMKRIL